MLKRIMRNVGGGVLAIAARSSIANAEPVNDGTTERQAVTIMISPFALLFPIAEVTVEVSPAPKFGAAAIIGVGQISIGGNTASVLEGGAQANYYLHDFHGPHLGVEALYAYGNDGKVSFGALVVGPYAGWKYVNQYGLALVIQLGIGVVATGTPMDDHGRVNPLVNVKFGWSF